VFALACVPLKTFRDPLKDTTRPVFVLRGGSRAVAGGLDVHRKTEGHPQLVTGRTTSARSLAFAHYRCVCRRNIPALGGHFVCCMEGLVVWD
jgi:hypothetical protein